MFFGFFIAIALFHTSNSRQPQVITGTTVEGNNITLQLKTTEPTNVTLWKSSVYSNPLGYIIQRDRQCMASDMIGHSPSMFAWHCHAYTEYALILKNVSHKWHNTTWTGILPNQGYRMQKFILYVEVPITFVDITPATPIVNAIENEEVQLTCKTSSGRPVANVSWYTAMSTPGDAGDRLMITSNITSTTDINSDGLGVTTSILRYLPTRRDNDRHIYCMANNSDGAIMSKIKPMLNVIYNSKQKFSINGQMGQSPIIVSEDSSVSLECQVDSNPASRIRILYNNKILTERNSAKVLTYFNGNLKCESSGVYFCISSNSFDVSWAEVRKISLFVQCRPKPVSLVRKIVYTHRGMNASIVVDLIAYPELKHNNIIWKKFENKQWARVAHTDEETSVSTVIKTTHTVPSVTEAKLMFHNISATDAGDYKLSARNDVGVYEAVVTLIINDTESPVSIRTNGSFKDSTNDTSINVGRVCTVVFSVLTTCMVLTGFVYYWRNKQTNRDDTTQTTDIENEARNLNNIYSELNIEERILSEHVYSPICLTDDTLGQRREQAMYENTKIKS